MLQKLTIPGAPNSPAVEETMTTRPHPFCTMSAAQRRVSRKGASRLSATMLCHDSTETIVLAAEIGNDELPASLLDKSLEPGLRASHCHYMCTLAGEQDSRGPSHAA